MKKVILAVALVGLLASSALADYAVGFWYGGPYYYHGPTYTYYHPHYNDCGPYYHTYGHWSPGIGFTYYHH